MYLSTGQGVMDPPEFLEGRPQAYSVDQGFTEAINQKMQVPERLSVGVGPREEGTEKLEDLTLAYRMHVPDRLSLAGGCWLAGRTTRFSCSTGGQC